MSKIIYYIGAGTSYGTPRSRYIEKDDENNERLVITEGMPIVSEIPVRMKLFRKAVASVEIDPSVMYIFKKMYQQHGGEIERYRMEMLRDIDDITEAIAEHATIDTYAKKLALVDNRRKLTTLKNVLCAFFVWEQLDHKPDNRYDTFLANVLTMTNLQLPKELSVISWNYDSQFEMAYRFYSRKQSLPIYEKNTTDWEVLSEWGRIFKVNGSASFADISVVRNILEDNELPKIIQLIMFYHDVSVDTSGCGYQFTNHLSFAWDKSGNQAKMIEAIGQTTQDTESIVVIGYSFPFFNREIDRAIFADMPNLKHIYIQDPYAESVEQSLLAVLPANSKVQIEHRKDCRQFYLPVEL